MLDSRLENLLVACECMCVCVCGCVCEIYIKREEEGWKSDNIG